MCPSCTRSSNLVGCKTGRSVTLENVARYMLPRQINEPGDQGF
jgi:hypothetical protein